MAIPRVLIVEDELTMLKGLEKIMKGEGYGVTTTADGDGALRLIREKDFDAVLTDLKLPRVGGMEVLKETRERSPETEVIIITAFATVENAVEAMKLGAYDYIAKPFNVEELKVVVRKALEKRRLTLEVRHLRSEVESRYGFHSIVGNSARMKAMFAVLAKVAPTDTTVLILGESGTGKELVARALHYSSSRRRGMFVPVNCGALTDSLLESELFGHVKGAFTGAIADKRGLLEVAGGGTLFFDEIADVSLAVQSKLLRVLQEREFKPVGGTEILKTDVRIIAATNRQLEEAVEKGEFREDLYYRLNVVSMHLPPLRERKEDIPLLVEHFIAKSSEKLGKEIEGVSPAAMKCLMSYNWPGNVRELENVIERGLVLQASGRIEEEDLPERVRAAGAGGPPGGPAVGLYAAAKRVVLDSFHKEFLRQLLASTRGNVTQAAQKAGLDRANLQRLMRRYGIKSETFRGP